MRNNGSVGIICEYNPFHSGHMYQIEELRRRGYEKIVCVMSGNAVQRGELAIADKYIRAEMAVKGGADLVLELPFPYSSSSAEYFALAGVRILDCIGVDAICFGSECGDIESLRAAADVCDSDEFANEYKKNVLKGNGTASAYFEAYKCLTGKELPGGSNDILAISYLRALKKEGSEMLPIAIKREGSDYRADEFDADTKHPSATMLRKYICERGLDDGVRGLIPEKTLEPLSLAVKSGKAPVMMSELDSAVIAMLRLLDKSKAENISEAKGGLGDRILSEAQESTDYRTLIQAICGKNYPEARSQRAVLNMLLGVCEDDVKSRPQYSVVLGFNSVGRELLARLRKDSAIALVTKPADALALGEKAKRQKELSDRLDALFTLAAPVKSAASEYIKRSPYRMI